MKRIVFCLLMLGCLFPFQVVLAADAPAVTSYTVLSRGHIQDVGDFPLDGTWVTSPNRIGTVGECKRIEGFEIKPGDDLPDGIQIRYNVHVQDVGWLYDENDVTSWAKDGDFAGTRARSLRIEAIKIVLTDPSGNKLTDYHIRYRGHIENFGNTPADENQWLQDGEKLGTVGSSLRLEALKLEITKDAAQATDLTAYNALLKAVETLKAADYTQASWDNLQSVLNKNKVTAANSEAEVAAAVKLIQAAADQLEKLLQAKTYDQAGTYGPATGTETIGQDVVIAADGVTLQNLTIDGNLTITEAVGDGDVTLNNVTVTGETRVRGGGVNSIHINGGKYEKIVVEKTPTGTVRIVTRELSGASVVLSDAAKGEKLILEGAFSSVAVNAPDVTVETRNQTSIGELTVAPAASNSTMNLGSQTTVAELSVQAPAHISGTGTVQKAAVDSDSVVFEKAPDSCTVDPGVHIPPVIPAIPTPSPGGGDYTPPSKINLSVATPPTVTPAKTYDGTTATNVTGQPAVSGIVAGDDVQVVANASYDNKNAGTGKTITISYSLTGTAAAKYNAPAATTVTGEITQKYLISPTTTPISKAFDGMATLDTVINEDLGQLASDTLTITRTATYQNNTGKTDAIEVGTGKPVTCSYRLSGTDAGNYSAPANHTGTGTITKKNLTVSAASLNISKTKTYDGTTAVYNSAGNIIGTGNNSINVATGVTSDANIIVTAAVAYNDKNASNNRTISVNYMIGSTSANSRYQVTPTETISGASITPCQLTLPNSQVPTPVAKAYDGTADVFTAANNTGKIYNKPVTPDNIATADTGKVTVSATATYDAGKDVGTAKKTTIHYALSGDAAGNYLAPPDEHKKTAAITPLTLTVGPLTNKAKEYDGSSTAKPNVDLSCSDNIDLFKSEAGTSLLSKIDSKYYTDSACSTETSEIGTGLYLKYTITLEGASASNYVFTGNSPTFTGNTGGGSITQKKLTVSADDLGLQTAKTYDGNNSVSLSITTITRENGLTGIVGTDQVTAAVSSYYVDANDNANDNANANAGDHNIKTSFSLSGKNCGNYCIDHLTSSGTIKPLQLTVDNTKLPVIAATRKYDGTTDVYLDGTTTKLSDYDVSGAVSGVINNDAVVKATASYVDKNIGSGKTVTITYRLDGTAAGNYLAPADTSKTAAITARTLGYSVSLLEPLKKWDGDSSVNFSNPNGLNDVPVAVEKTVIRGDGIVEIGGNREDVSLGSYSANYYENDLSNTTSATGSHPIVITGTLAGKDAGNYVIGDYTYTEAGEIMDENAVVTATYDKSSGWSDWSDTGKTLAAGYKPFYSKDGATFYALGSDKKIYQSYDFSNWTPYTGTAFSPDTVIDTTGKQLIGIDDSLGLLAIDSNYTEDAYGNKDYQIYSWYNDWGNYSKISNVTPINPTYYSDSSTNDSYLIYQDSHGLVNQRKISADGIPTAITGSLAPLSGFTNSLIFYNGTTLMVYAY